MNRALRLPILFSGFIFSILVSLSAFSIRSYARVETSLPATYAYTNTSYNYVMIDSGAASHFSFMFVINRSNRFYPCLVFDSNISSTTRYYYSSAFNPSSSDALYTGTPFVFDGHTYYYYVCGSAQVSAGIGTAIPDLVYSDANISKAFDDWKASQGPEFADFGFNNITYTTYLQPTASLLFESYNFDALSYYFKWDGSTSSDFPITSFNYELYGFFDVAMSNTDKSNGELVDSGSHSIPNLFDYQVPYGSLTDIFGGMKYDKVILYLTPFSNITEGNTFYVVLNTVRNIGFSANFGPFDIDFGGSVRDVQYSDGVLPVPQTDALLIDDNKYMPVGYIDEVPVIYAIRTTSGSYNKHIDIYNENISYAPVVYGDTDYITNNDNSSVINNNQTYNMIINNINGTVNIDPDSNSSVNNVVDFLKTLITFFATCWNLFSGSMTFIPSWAITIVNAFYSLTGSILVGLVILKLIRG